MNKRPTFENLGEHLNEPTVQGRVISYMDSIGAPMLLREIYRPLGLPRQTVNRVLLRLHGKGFVMRYKIPVETHLPAREAGSRASAAAMRQCFLYSFVQDAPT